MKKIIPIMAALLAPLALLAQEKKGPYESGFELPGSRAEVYKTIGDVKLKIYIYEPKGHKAAAKRRAIVFFFGGGWRGGTPRQFLEHCRYLASKGMVAMTADYRVSSRQGTKPVHCVRDGKSAVRWIRQNAPTKIRLQGYSHSACSKFPCSKRRVKLSSQDVADKIKAYSGQENCQARE